MSLTEDIRADHELAEALRELCLYLSGLSIIAGVTAPLDPGDPRMQRDRSCAQLAREYLQGGIIIADHTEGGIKLRLIPPYERLNPND